MGQSSRFEIAIVFSSSLGKRSRDLFGIHSIQLCPPTARNMKVNENLTWAELPPSWLQPLGLSQLGDDLLHAVALASHASPPFRLSYRTRTTIPVDQMRGPDSAIWLEQAFAAL
jgi:hypothetical protein